MDVKTVRFFAYRIKPHAPPLVRAPVNYLSFNLRRTPYLTRCSEATPRGTTSVDIVYGVDYCVVFNFLLFPYIAAPERQSFVCGRLSPPVFLQISPFLTATPEFYPLQDTQACQFRMQFVLSPGISHPT